MNIGSGHLRWITVALLVLAPSGSAAGQEPVASREAVAGDAQKRVLSLLSTRREALAGVELDRALQLALSERLGKRLDYYSEHIDITRFAEPAYLAALRDFLRSKYEGRRPFDLVIATSDATAEFLRLYRHEIVPGTPVVFIGGPDASAGSPSAAITMQLNFRDTLDVALRLQPDTERVAVISGAAEWDEYYEAVARAQFQAFEDRVQFTHLKGLPMPELLHRVATLPARTIIYFITFVEDGSGMQFLTLDAMDTVAAAANRPIYAWHSVAMDHGIVGGSLQSPDRTASAIATLALQVLNGDDPVTIPRRSVDTKITEFDWREMRRWGIDESRVPPGSVVRYRVPTPWERYWPYILAGLSVLLLQTALIGGLLLQRSRRMRIEARLSESQKRYELATAAGAVGVWDWNVETDDLYVDPQLKQILGYRDHEIINRRKEWVALTPAEDGFMSAALACSEGLTDTCEVEHRMRHRNGAVRWFLTRGSAVKRPDGTVSRIVGTVTDITERKHAREAILSKEASLRASHEKIEHLAGRLIAAQEAERARIARDLHDDVSQQLAGLSIGLSALKRRLAPDQADPAVPTALSSLQERAIAVGESIRALSHDLHPRVVEHAGLVAALSAHCGALQREQAIAVSFRSAGDFDGLPATTALCLFRVAQEALRNVVSHSGAAMAHVEIIQVPDAVQLVIADDGRGFDAGAARRGGVGLGLLSIHERVRLAGGTVNIESEPGHGTTLRVRLPTGAMSATTAGLGVSSTAS